jgi:hypothetical protein
LPRALVGGLELVAWFVRPGWIAADSFVWIMKANTAACVTVSAVGLRLLLSGAQGGTAVAVARALGGLVLLVGLVTLGEYLLGKDLGIDHVVALDRSTALPGRMAPQTALAMAMLGASVTLGPSRGTWACRLCDVMLLGLAAVVLLALTGYVYEVTVFYGVSGHTRTSPQTILALVLVLGAAVAGRARTGAFAVLFKDGLGSQMARLLLPAVILAPLALGELRWIGERYGWFSASNGAAGIVLAHMFLLAGLLWIAANKINRIDLEHQAEQARRQDLEKYVVMCAWTRRIRLDGIWVPVEEFLKKRFGLQVSHGMSDDALQEQLFEMAKADNAAGPPNRGAKKS